MLCVLAIQLVAEVVAKELERAKVTEGNQSDELNTDDENEEEEVCYVTSCDLSSCHVVYTL